MNRPSYVELDQPLGVDIDINALDGVDYDNWDLPQIDYERVIPGWNEMSHTEKIVCKTVEDPFFFHVAIMGYDRYEMQGEWMYMYAKHRDTLVLAPVSFGKSMCTSVSYPTWRYHQNCNKRMALISATEDLTEGNMGEINQHLVSNPKFKAVFTARWGHGPVPDKERNVYNKWSSLQKLCYRTKPIGVRDMTFLGIGLFGAMFGRRFDEIVMDDPFDPVMFYKMNPDVLEKIIKQMEANLFTRTEADGAVKVIGTFEAAYDTYHYMIENYWPTWQIYKYRAINKKGQPHRIDITAQMREIQRRKDSGEEYEDIDLTIQDGL